MNARLLPLVAALGMLTAQPSQAEDLMHWYRAALAYDASYKSAQSLLSANEAKADQAVAGQLSVREVEKLVRRKAGTTHTPRRARGERDPGDAADIAAVQAHQEEYLGLQVRINADADPRSGSVTIRYRTLDQLDLICQRLTGGSI